jgi:two-component system LytT family response regulator
MNASVRVLIVDDEAHARTNLRMALAGLPGWEVAGECAGAAAARWRRSTCTRSTTSSSR